MLLTDGAVLMHDACTPNWYRLTPDINGSYLNGAWSKTPSVMPDGYAPKYFVSAIMPYGGYLLVLGGEYERSADPGCSEEVWSARAASFDPTYGWWNLQPPPNWKRLGDAPSVLLTHGKVPRDTNYFLVGQSGDLTTKKQSAWSWIQWGWTTKGSGKSEPNAEEGWTLLRDSSVLAVDTNIALGANTPYEIYDPVKDKWSTPGTAGAILVDAVNHEIGPAVLMPSGHVFQVGASPCGDSSCAAHTGIYLPEDHSWAVGPDVPNGLFSYYDSADGPAALLTNGRVLVQVSPGYGKAPSHFYEYDEATNKFTRVSEPKSAPCIGSYQGRMLELPSGEILWSSDSDYSFCPAKDVEVYRPDGGPDLAWKPTITTMPAEIGRGGQGYLLKGARLMGLSQGAAYGDDAQMATNYPIIEIRNSDTAHVCFARTYYWFPHENDWTGEGEVEFDVPSACEAGPASLTVVANGIASDPVAVRVRK